MQEKLVDLVQLEIMNARDVNALNDIKIKYLGRNGLINNELRKIKNFTVEDKKKAGKTLNNIKNKISSLLADKLNEIAKHVKLNDIDITLPGIGLENGRVHIINETLKKIEEYFLKFGFNVVNGYEIDTEFYNFQALNMPKSHPSRNMLETFYLNEKLLLRTHTSNMQIHFMSNNTPPFKVLSYGKVYRRDSDISHTPMFHQVEGFVVDKDISLANLKFLLTDFLSFFFNKNIEMRMRASYFPFTEPSMEVDIRCVSCMGTLCQICKYTGWIEILGCGIIHSNVFKNCGIKNEKYSGFAFGMGVERITMIKHNISDLRLFFENNIEFLNQF